MKHIIDRKFITLNNRGKQAKVVVYLKEVETSGSGKVVRAFCRTVDPKKIEEGKLLVP